MRVRRRSSGWANGSVNVKAKVHRCVGVCTSGVHFVLIFVVDL